MIAIGGFAGHGLGDPHEQPQPIVLFLSVGSIALFMSVASITMALIE